MRARSEKVKIAFKVAAAGRGDDCCEVCRWRPPKVLREIAGGFIESLLHAHHVLPIACGGADHSDNLILVCPTHHAMAHHMGQMVQCGKGQDNAWWGPRNRHELLTCFTMLAKLPDEYKKLAALGHDVGRYLEAIHEEALQMNADNDIRNTRAFTLVRGRAS